MTIYLDSLPSEVANKRVLSAPDAAQFCNFSLPHWRRLTRDGTGPKPIKLSARRVGWQLGDLIAWLEAKKAA